MKKRSAARSPGSPIWCVQNERFRIYRRACAVYSRRLQRGPPLAAARKGGWLQRSVHLCAALCGSVCVHTAAPHGHSVCLIGRADTALSASHLHSGSAECLPRSLSVSDILSHTFSFSLILYTRHFAALALLIFTFILRASNVRTSDEPRAFEPPAFESLALGCFRVKNHVKNCPHSNYQRKWPGALWAPHWLSSIQR